MKDGYAFEIENFLAGEMSEAERVDFENRLRSDTELSSLFELYRSIELGMIQDQQTEVKRQELQSALDELGKKYFAPGILSAGNGKAPVVPIGNRRSYSKILAIAASVVLILAAYFVFFDKPDARQLADSYVKDNLSILSQTMDGAKDSLQQGIAAYNDKAYAKALEIFDALYAAHPENTDALLYAGITRLATGDHDAAISKFSALSAQKHLFSNPGLFLKAVTLLQRDNPGDKEEARTTLQQVVDEDLENAVEAKKMLEHW